MHFYFREHCNPSSNLNGWFLLVGSSVSCNLFRQWEFEQNPSMFKENLTNLATANSLQEKNLHRTLNSPLKFQMIYQLYLKRRKQSLTTENTFGCGPTTCAILQVLLILSLDDAINTCILCYHFYFDNLFLDPKTKALSLVVWWKKKHSISMKNVKLGQTPVGPLTGATAKKTTRSSARLCCAFFKWDFSSGKRLKTCRAWQACGVLSGMGFWRERSVLLLLFFHTAQQWLVDSATLYFMFLNSFRNIKFQCNMTVLP